jgi:hypothetical protein
MRSQDLQEAIRFSKTDYPSVFHDPLIKVGYEIEFIAPKNHYSVMLNKLGQDLALSVKWDASNKQVVSGTWSLVQDQSIDPDYPLNEQGWELISPPLPVEQALMHLKDIFGWIEANKYYTNSTCGFHVNVSYADKTQKTDNLKLILLLGEHYLADLFQRATNEFATSHIQELKAKIRKNPQIVLSADTDINNLKTVLNRMLSKEKHRTVNLGKLAKKGYLEFRIAGGTNYHTQYQQMVDLILRYAFVIKASLDPNSFNKKYSQALAKLILGARSSKD